MACTVIISEAVEKEVMDTGSTRASTGVSRSCAELCV